MVIGFVVEDVVDDFVCYWYCKLVLFLQQVLDVLEGEMVDCIELFVFWYNDVMMYCYLCKMEFSLFINYLVDGILLFIWVKICLLSDDLVKGEGKVKWYLLLLQCLFDIMGLFSECIDIIFFYFVLICVGVV